MGDEALCYCLDKSLH